ncbi:MAG: hypothetical protein LQ352_002336 [Teloschistes flavicans]|nr:MAG: hypothetical protein LQ352_002336 [Teloschistes flavicans]
MNRPSVARRPHITIPILSPPAAAREKAQEFLEALNSPGLSIKDETETAYEFLRRYLEPDDPGRMKQRWRVLRKICEDGRVSRRSKRTNKANSQTKTRRHGTTDNDPSDGHERTSSPDEFDCSSSPTSDAAPPVDHTEVQYPRLDHSDDSLPATSADEREDRSANRKDHHTRDDHDIYFNMDEFHLRVSSSTTEPSVRETVSALMAHPALREHYPTLRFKRLIEKFVNALFSPASYYKVVESIQNILQISSYSVGIKTPREDRDDMKIKMQIAGKEPLCLRGLRDRWRQVMIIEKLQDPLWIRVKHLVLSVQSYSYWLTLSNLLTKPDCEEADFVRGLVKRAKKCERAQLRSSGKLTTRKASSDSRYLHLAVAQHLGLPGGEKQWRDFIAHAKAAHVLHRHWGLLAIVSHKTIYKEIGRDILQVAFKELLHRHPSLNRVAQALFHVYMEPLLGPGTLERSTLQGIMEINDHGQLVQKCLTHADGFVGVLKNHDPNAPEGSTWSDTDSIDSYQSVCSRSTPPSSPTATPQHVESQTDEQHGSPTRSLSEQSRGSTTPIILAPSTPAATKSALKNQLPTPGRSGAAGPAGSHKTSAADIPTHVTQKAYNANNSGVQSLQTADKERSSPPAAIDAGIPQQTSRGSPNVCPERERPSQPSDSTDLRQSSEHSRSRRKRTRGGLGICMVIVAIAAISIALYERWKVHTVSAPSTAISTRLIETSFQSPSGTICAILDSPADALEPGFSNLMRLQEALKEVLKEIDLVGIPAWINANDEAIQYHQQVVSAKQHLRDTIAVYNGTYSNSLSTLYEHITTERKRPETYWAWAWNFITRTVWPAWAQDLNRIMAEGVVATANNLLNNTQEVARLCLDYKCAADDWNEVVQKLHIDVFNASCNEVRAHPESSANHSNLARFKNFATLAPLNDTLARNELEMLTAPVASLARNVSEHAKPVVKESSRAVRKLQRLVHDLSSWLKYCQASGNCQELEDALKLIINNVEEIYKQQRDRARFGLR